VFFRNLHRQSIWPLLLVAVSADSITASPMAAPVAPASGLGNVIALANGSAIGGAFACALLDDRTVRCRGGNRYGQLGNGTTDNSDTAVPVTGLSGVKSLHAGGGHACAVLNSGAVRCWGSNTYGQLGNGTFGTDPVTTPVPVLRM